MDTNRSSERSLQSLVEMCHLKERSARVEAAIQVLAENTAGLVVPSHIERISKPSSLSFLRDYVSKNVPVIITGLLEDWPARKKWTMAYLEKQLQDVEVTVSQTPNGRADAITFDEEADEWIFAVPHDEKMSFSTFCELMRSRNDHPSAPINYIQYQNSNFQVEFLSSLEGDIDPQGAFDFADEVFQSSPDAVNIWIGEDRSVSSLHKDHYENLYAVIAGEKIFTLLPPTARPFLPEANFPTAVFTPQEEEKPACSTIDLLSRKFQVVRSPDESTVPWIAVDPSSAASVEAFTDYKSNCEPLVVHVREGEVLYLPSLWYHQVAQREDAEGKVVAMNWWYDMAFDIKYAYFAFLEKLCTTADH